MARKKMFSPEQQREIIDYYLQGYSTSDTGKQFGITGSTVYNICKKHGIKLRTVAEGNSLKWNIESFRENQIAKRKGKPSGALDKNWNLSKPKKYPTRKGAIHKWWKGGRTALTPQIKSSAEYSFWRMSIFRRDFFTCQICGAKNKVGEKYVFHADHIYPFSKILDDYNITTLEEAISCEKLWDISNGRTLCKDCHKKTPTWGMNSLKNVTQL